MTILEIFEKVNLTVPIEQRRFFNFFDDSVNELLSRYSGFVTVEKAEYVPIKSLYDDNIVLPLYHNAIVDNILFLSGQSESHKSEFLRKAYEAYLKYWNDNARGRRMRRTMW